MTIRFLRRCGGALALVAAATVLPAQTGWQLLDSLRPGALGAEALVEDAARGTVVLFGGETTSGATPYHLAEWDGAQWTAPAAGGAVPPGRVGHAMAFDTARGAVVVFGGRCVGACPGGPGPELLGATWEYAGGVWAERATATAPAPRWRASMAYDPQQQRTLLFGGRDAAFALLAETWEYDGVDWIQRTPAHTPPEGRLGWDPIARRVLLVGGGQTWAWDGDDWQDLGAPAPVADALATDALRERLVAYSPSNRAPWEWGGAGWQERALATSPLPEISFAMAWDPVGSRLLWITTQDLGTPTFRSTWAYGATDAATFAPFGTGCAGPGSDPQLDRSAGSLPWLGGTFAVSITGLPPGAADLFVVFGLEQVPPVELGFLGLPGCYQYVMPLTSDRLVGLGGSAEWSQPVPNAPVLVGMPFYCQAVVADATATGGAVLSNPGVGVVGVR
ncbi:MAG: hypothetical protein AB7O97_18730 [Planctomycetota bacterium]